ncbi:MAG: hypothetical protein WCF99_10700 [Chloroflexales bacterium]
MKFELRITKEGHTLVIEAADEFEREIALLRNSHAFMEFLAQRSQEKEGSISLDDMNREIDAAIAKEMYPDEDTQSTS